METPADGNIKVHMEQEDDWGLFQDPFSSEMMTLTWKNHKPELKRHVKKGTLLFSHLITSFIT